MKIKLDENLSRHLKAPLAQAGHDITTAAEEHLLGKADTSIAAAAKVEDRMVFTLDVGFADLRRFPPGSHPGIVLFRPVTLGPLAVNRFVLDFVQNQNLESLAGKLVVVEPKRIRIRDSRT